jgi:hypothetical protein
MIPFRVYDRDSKQVWIVVNYHPGEADGSYLMAREDDSGTDGDMRLATAKELATFKFVDFMDDGGDYDT